MIAPAVTRMRVLAQDVPWVVVPPSLTEQPEMVQLATLARAAARIAYGVPWLEEMAPPHIEALLVAAARQVVPGYGEGDLDVLAAKLVSQQEAGVGRALARRQRKLLDELAPHIALPSSRVPAVDVFASALVRAELRTAFVLTGDLLRMMRRDPPHGRGPAARARHPRPARPRERARPPDDRRRDPLRPHARGHRAAPATRGGVGGVARLSRRRTRRPAPCR